MTSTRVALTMATILLATAAVQAETTLPKGSADMTSAGALAFGPDGVLFVADVKSAAIYAIGTGDTPKTPSALKSVNGIDGKIASALGTTTDQMSINDMAINPLSGAAFFSVSRGLGAKAQPVIIRVAPSGDISEVPTKDIPVAKAELPNPPAATQGRRNRRLESITDIEYQDGKLLVAGLSNEEFASTFRAIPFPFQEVGKGAAVEIYHASHGKFETRSPIRAFTTYKIADKPHVLAGYTCTPLVKIPLDNLEPGKKVRGVTLAELGNRNRPLDMFVYKKGGDDFVLMANSARGVMKINTKDMTRTEGLTERIRGKAGQEYETIESLTGVEQLAQLDDDHAVILVKAGSQYDLKTIELP